MSKIEIPVFILMFLWTGLCSGQTTRSPAATSSASAAFNSTTAPTTTTTSTQSFNRGVGPTSTAFTSTISPLGQGQRNYSYQDGSLWLRCVGQPRPREEMTVASLLMSWCQQNETIVNCLSRDFVAIGLNNALDFFVNLTFNQQQLRQKSSAVCSKYEENRDKFGCAASVNQSHMSSCLGSFSSGLAHVFGLYSEKKLTFELLRDVACDVMLQTTLCLRDTLSTCEEDIQSVLVNYYSLFTNESCIAKFGQNSGTILPETVVDKCAKEAAEMMPSNQPEPVSLRDFLLLGLRTDCKTYSVRYGCYGRELGNITNFRDFWLSLTFDYDNAMASQKTYCDQIESTVINKINEDCFSQSHPNLAACEIGFGRELEAIRDEWFGNSNLDGLELQTLACRTSVARAACLNHAMQPCGSEVASIMAVSEMGILPDICRQLLLPETLPQDLKNKSGPDFAYDSSLLNSNGNQGNAGNRSRINATPSSFSTSTTSSSSFSAGRLRPGDTTQTSYTQRSAMISTTASSARIGARVNSGQITGNVRPDSSQVTPLNNGSQLRTEQLNHQHNVSTTTSQQLPNNRGAGCGQITVAGIVLLFSVVWLVCIV